jgi:hypothetical protein
VKYLQDLKSRNVLYKKLRISYQSNSSVRKLIHQKPYISAKINLKKENSDNSLYEKPTNRSVEDYKTIPKKLYKEEYKVYLNKFYKNQVFFI